MNGTLLAAVMTVVVNAWNERRVPRSRRRYASSSWVHRTSALQELRWSSVDDFRPKVEGTRQIIGVAPTPLENQLLNACRSSRRRADQR